MKIIGIVKNNCITGVEYGVIEIADFKEKHSKPEPKVKKIKGKNKSFKQNSHLKSTCVEKETKKAKKKAKARYRVHATITLSYKYKPTQKTVDLNTKRFKKAKTLFKKQQRAQKTNLQNIAQYLGVIEPLFDCIELINRAKESNQQRIK